MVGLTTVRASRLQVPSPKETIQWAVFACCTSRGDIFSVPLIPTRSSTLGQSTSQVDTYFILDTDTGKRTSFQTASALKVAAARIGIQPNLRPINEVYSEYRFTWFDVFVGLLFVALPLIALGFLYKRIVRLRRTGILLRSPWVEFSSLEIGI